MKNIKLFLLFLFSVNLNILSTATFNTIMSISQKMFREKEDELFSKISFEFLTFIQKKIIYDKSLTKEEKYIFSEYILLMAPELLTKSQIEKIITNTNKHKEKIKNKLSCYIQKSHKFIIKKFKKSIIALEIQRINFLIKLILSSENSKTLKIKFLNELKKIYTKNKNETNPNWFEKIIIKTQNLYIQKIEKIINKLKLSLDYL